MKRCDTVGVAVKNVVLPANVTQDVLLQNVEALNNDKSVSRRPHLPSTAQAFWTKRQSAMH
jgi:hypothetical protein